MTRPLPSSAPSPDWGNMQRLTVTSALPWRWTLVRDHPGAGGQEDLRQAGRGRRRKALLEGLWANLDAQSSRCVSECFQGRLGIPEEPKHQGPG